MGQLVPKTRHIVIWMKPSIPDKAFGATSHGGWRHSPEDGALSGKTPIRFTDPSADGIAARIAVGRA
ncbi:MAG: hypothetical protein ALECFALPRED_008843, partial [Alectoria fallacina]